MTHHRWTKIFIKKWNLKLKKIVDFLTQSESIRKNSKKYQSVELCHTHMEIDGIHSQKFMEEVMDEKEWKSKDFECKSALPSCS